MYLFQVSRWYTQDDHSMWLVVSESLENAMVSFCNSQKLPHHFIGDNNVADPNVERANHYIFTRIARATSGVTIKMQ